MSTRKEKEVLKGGDGTKLIARPLQGELKIKELKSKVNGQEPVALY